jgi:hypothetical protein
MLRVCIQSIAAILLTATMTLLTNAAPPPGVYAAKPPAEIDGLLTRLKKRENTVDVIQKLSQMDEAAPYLRAELSVTLRRHPYYQDLVDLVAKHQARTYERNRKRYEKWAEEGRLDLCAELLISCPVDDDAPILADLTIPFRKKISEQFDKACNPYNKKLFWELEFARHPYKQLAGDDLSISYRTAGPGPVLIRANKCTTEVYDRGGWFVAVQSELHERLPKDKWYGEWYRSIVLVNNSIALPRVSDSLIICDGDVKLASHISQCVIIANGSIRYIDPANAIPASNGQVITPWIEGKCYICASGSIDLPENRLGQSSVYHAGKSVTLAQKPEKSDRILKNQKALPFGIKFLDPSDFGLEVAARNDEVQVVKIDKDSIFAKYGLEVGDVIFSIDLVPITSVQEFRRHLRRGVLAESAMLRVKRNGEMLTRFVYFDGVPVL